MWRSRWTHPYVSRISLPRARLAWFGLLLRLSTSGDDENEDEDVEDEEHANFLTVRNFKFVHDFGVVMLLNAKVSFAQIAKIMERQRSSIGSRISCLTKAIGISDGRPGQPLQAKDVMKLRKLVAPQSSPSIRYGELTDEQISDAANTFLTYIDGHPLTSHFSEAIRKAVPKGILKDALVDAPVYAQKRVSTTNEPDSGEAVVAPEGHDPKRRRLHNPSTNAVQEVDESSAAPLSQTHSQAQLPGGTQSDPYAFNSHESVVMATQPATPEHGTTPPRAVRESLSFGGASTGTGEVSAPSAALSSTDGLDANTTHSGNVYTTREGVFSYCRTEEATESIKEHFLSKFNLKNAPILEGKDTEWDLEEGQYVVGAFNMMAKQNCVHYMLNKEVRVSRGSVHMLGVRDH